MDAAKCVVVLWSKQSIHSEWVLEEANIGKRRGVLVPAKIDPVEPPLGFGLIQAADLTDWASDTSHAEFEGFLTAISDIVGPLRRPENGDQVADISESSLEQPSEVPHEDRIETLTRKYELRNEPLAVSDEEAEKVFNLDQGMRPLKYINNEFNDNADGTVTDHATGLIWQKSGSRNYLSYEKGQGYIEQLNRERFAGHSNWRLPTIPELMSLLEPQKQTNGLYIDPIFDADQRWCWSSDKGSLGSAWAVFFDGGTVDWYNLNKISYVRGVRS